MRDRNARSARRQEQMSIGRVARTAGAVEYFNVLTSRELLEATFELNRSRKLAKPDVASRLERKVGRHLARTLRGFFNEASCLAATNALLAHRFIAAPLLNTSVGAW
jgi:hypothetical protein